MYYHKVMLECVCFISGPWSAFRAWAPGLHGIGKLHVVNATHIHWQQIIAKDESIMDDIWIVQLQHSH